MVLFLENFRGTDTINFTLYEVDIYVYEHVSS